MAFPRWLITAPEDLTTLCFTWTIPKKCGNIRPYFLLRQLCGLIHCSFQYAEYIAIVELIFNQWLDYRDEIKKPYKSDFSIQKLANKFNQHTVECCNYVVDLSISNQWQGLFWDKYTEQKKTPNTRKTINRSDFFTD